MGEYAHVSSICPHPERQVVGLIHLSREPSEIPKLTKEKSCLKLKFHMYGMRHANANATQKNGKGCKRTVVYRIGAAL